MYVTEPDKAVASYRNMECQVDYAPVNIRDPNGGMICPLMDHIIQDRSIGSWIKHNHHNNDNEECQAGHHEFAQTHPDHAEIYFSRDGYGTGNWSHTALQHGCGNIDFVDG